MASNSMPTSDTRAQASTTIPLSRIRSITSARLLDAFSFSMAIDVLLILAVGRRFFVRHAALTLSDTRRLRHAGESHWARRHSPQGGRKADGTRGNPSDVKGVRPDFDRLSRTRRAPAQVPRLPLARGRCSRRAWSQARRRRARARAGHHQVAPRLGARISGAAGDLSHARGDVTERGYAWAGRRRIVATRSAISR